MFGHRGAVQGKKKNSDPSVWDKKDLRPPVGHHPLFTVFRADQQQSCIFAQLFRTDSACHDSLAENCIPCSGQRGKKKNILCPAAAAL